MASMVIMGNDFQDETSLVFGYEVFCSIIGPGVYERAQWTNRKY